MLMLVSLCSLVACRMGGNNPDNNNPGTNDTPGDNNNNNNNNNNDDATNDNNTDNENSDGSGNGDEMPALTGEKIEISFNDEGYAVGRPIESTVTVRIPENKLFNNVEFYEVVLVKGVYDAMVYPEKDHAVLTTILKSDQNDYKDTEDIDNNKYHIVKKDISIPVESLSETSGKFTVALIGLKSNNDKSIISSGYTTYSYKIDGNKLTINK